MMWLSLMSVAWSGTFGTPQDSLFAKGTDIVVTRRGQTSVLSMDDEVSAAQLVDDHLWVAAGGLSVIDLAKTPKVMTSLATRDDLNPDLIVSQGDWVMGLQTTGFPWRAVSVQVTDASPAKWTPVLAELPSPVVTTNPSALLVGNMGQGTLWLKATQPLATGRADIVAAIGMVQGVPDAPAAPLIEARVYSSTVITTDDRCDLPLIRTDERVVWACESALYSQRLHRPDKYSLVKQDMGGVVVGLASHGGAVTVLVQGANGVERRSLRWSSAGRFR